MPTFSLIVPIYKIEEYLPKCIDSVLAQKNQDFELLLIDDGSPDNSGKLIDDYAARFPDKIRAIHQPNGGAGAARNHGISLAQGEYLLFVDGDDYLDDTLLSDLSAEIQKSHADLYLFGAHVERNGVKNGELHELVEVGKLCNAKSDPKLFFGIMAPWNRAYKKELFANIEFASKVWYEDIRIVTKVNALAKSVIRLQKPYYHYLQREGSAMNNKNSERNVEILYAFDDILSWFKEQNLYETYRHEVTFLAIQHILIAATVRILQIDRKHHLIADFRSYMEKNFPDYQSNPYLPLLDQNKQRIYQLLLKKRYRTIKAIFKIKNLLGK